MCVRLIVFLHLIKHLLQTLIFSDVSMRRMIGGAVVVVVVAIDRFDEVMGLLGPATLLYGPAGLQRSAEEQTARRSHSEEILHLKPLRAAVVTQQLREMIH